MTLQSGDKRVNERKPLEIDQAKSPEYCDLCSFGDVKCLVAIRARGVSFICRACLGELVRYWEATKSEQ